MPFLFQKDGPLARLFSWGPARGRIVFRALPWLLPLALVTAEAREDILQVVTGLDYDRQFWMKPHPCSGERWLESVPGLPRKSAACPNEETAEEQDTVTAPPRVSAAQAWHYRRLYAKSGKPPTLAHEDQVSALEIRFRPAAPLDIRSTLEYGTWNRAYGGTPRAFELGQAGDAWRLGASLALPVVPWLVPLLAVDATSEGEREVALAARGALSGFSWSLVTGSRQLDFPMVLDLPDYSPLEPPFRLRQDFHAAALAWNTRRTEITWTSRVRENRHPETFDALYTLSDSGSTLAHRAGGAVFNAWDGNHYRLSLEAEYLRGSHALRGVRSTDILYQFSYEEVRHRADWWRADLQGGRGRWEGGLFAGGAWMEGNALRPDVPAGRYFWDRSGVLDSFEGGVLDIFSRETWLLDGSAVYAQQAFGAWIATRVRGWNGRFGLAHQSLEMKAQAHLTKRKTVLIISHSEEDHYPEFPGLRAQILIPELRLSRTFGRAFLEASVAQAVPLSFELLRKDGTQAARATGDRSSWSGGTEAAVRVGWGQL